MRASTDLDFWPPIAAAVVYAAIALLAFRPLGSTRYIAQTTSLQAHPAGSTHAGLLSTDWALQNNAA